MLPSQTMPIICSYRRAHGSVGEKAFINNYLLPMLKGLAPDAPLTVDGYGNMLLDMGRNDLMFVAHVDTVHRQDEPERQSVKINEETLTLANYTSKNEIPGCLGADDGSGIAVMLYLISEGVKAQYLFTRCEERGGYGAEYFRENSKDVLGKVKMAIEVDRRGTTEIIYSQGVGDCASQTFTKALCKEIGMEHKPSDRGSYTDVATFADVVPECVNIAAGYGNAHSASEYVDLTYLDELAQALVVIDELTWNNMPVERKPGDFGYSPYWEAVGYYSSPNRYKSHGRKLEFNEIYEFVVNDPEGAALLLQHFGITQDDLIDLYEDMYVDDDMEKNELWH
ncbi:M28 family peptidase [Pasteurella multocida]|uniref:M20/M25/M40 family metallo-hydrolase n=1 Tax=Pasteurella multocida TaxID=747 RepID=UPI002B480517|nr:M20/M25/M40 family metallo-hydrolase [Pasteurella multocida]WRK07742.1 M28 family peptidase [Pasteurella multocida]